MYYSNKHNNMNHQADSELIKFLVDLKTYLPTNLQNELKLPSIIAIGAENNGKSSLLARIIELHLLPVMDGTCTKCPVRVSILKPSEVITGEYRVTISAEEDTAAEESFEVQSKEELATKCKETVERINGTRISEDRTIKDPTSSKCSEFSDKFINIKVESLSFPVNMTFTDVPGYTNHKQKKFALDEIYSRVLTEDKNSIALWVHQATSTLGGTSVDSQMLKDLMGENCEKRVIGVVTKVDNKANINTSRSLLTNSTESQGVELENVKWFGVINRNEEENESFKSIKSFEKKTLKELLPDVEEDRLGIEALTSALNGMLIERTKEVLGGNLKDQILSILKESRDFIKLEDKYNYRPYNRAYPKMISKLKSMIKNDLRSKSQLSTTLDDANKTFETKVLSIRYETKFDLFYDEISQNSGKQGVEKCVGTSSTVLNKRISEYKSQLATVTNEYFDGVMESSMKALRKSILESDLLKEESNDFKKLFFSKLCGSASPYVAERKDVERLLEEALKTTKRMLFRELSNPVVERYNAYTAAVFSEYLEEAEKQRQQQLQQQLKPKTSFGHISVENSNEESNEEIENEEGLSADQITYRDSIHQYISENPTRSMPDDDFIKVLHAINLQTGTIGYIVIQFLPALILTKFFDVTKKLPKIFEEYQPKLEEFYEKDRKAKQQAYLQQKPDHEKIIYNIEFLIDSYPAIFSD